MRARQVLALSSGLAAATASAALAAHGDTDDLPTAFALVHEIDAPTSVLRVEGTLACTSNQGTPSGYGISSQDFGPRGDLPIHTAGAADFQCEGPVGTTTTLNVVTVAGYTNWPGFDDLDFHVTIYRTLVAGSPARRQPRDIQPANIICTSVGPGSVDSSGLVWAIDLVTPCTVANGPNDNAHRYWLEVYANQVPGEFLQQWFWITQKTRGIGSAADYRDPYGAGQGQCATYSRDGTGSDQMLTDCLTGAIGQDFMFALS